MTNLISRPHISNICTSDSMQLNAFVRSNCFVGFEERKVLINSFILWNFNDCRFVWFISSANPLFKLENLPKQALEFLHNDDSTSYGKLFKKSGKINVRNYCTLWKEIFRLRITNCPKREKYKVNLATPKSNQVRFGTKSLKYLGRKVWTLPYNIKSSGNLSNLLW